MMTETHETLDIIYDIVYDDTAERFGRGETFQKVGRGGEGEGEGFDSEFI